MMEHRVTFKVYYEDTDSLGVVYYANYLKFLERGRTEYVGSFGKDIRDWNKEGFYFVVYAMNIKFRKPAELGDSIEIVSRYTLPSAYRAVFHQRVERANELLVEADVELVCLGQNRVVREFPSFSSTT
jgi:tol-pal system-associated acyl-CoA thioesterase